MAGIVAPGWLKECAGCADPPRGVQEADLRRGRHRHVPCRRSPRPVPASGRL